MSKTPAKTLSEALSDMKVPFFTEKRKCEILTDSCCDLPATVVKNLGISVMGLRYIMSDGEHEDDMWQSITPHDFYERMRLGETPTTSQVPLGVIEETFTRILKSEVPTVYLAFSEKLSGTYGSAAEACERLSKEYPKGELHVVNTKVGSTTEGLLVLEACRQRDRGLSARKLAAWAEEACNYIHCYFTLDSFDALKRGGRIPSSAAFVGAKLDVKPVLCWDDDGRLAFDSMARGRRKAIKSLLAKFEEEAVDPGKTPVIIGGADASHDVQTIAEHVEKLGVPATSIVLCDIGPVIGSHVGPGMLSIQFFGADRREQISIPDRIANALRDMSDASVSAFKSAGEASISAFRSAGEASAQALRSAIGYAGNMVPKGKGKKKD